MGASTEFRSIYRHGFARVAACTTRCTLADPAANAAAILEVARDCRPARRGARGVPGTRPVRLRDQRPAAPVHAAGRGGGGRRGPSSRRPADLLPLLLVGAPLRHAGALYNCALAIHRGRLLGVVPKIHLPNYREFYEPRHFVAGDGMVGGEIAIGAHDRAVRHRPAVRGRGRAEPHRARRDLRGHLGPDAAQLARPRWPAPRCSPTCRPATSPSARRRRGGCCAPRNRRAASRPISTPRRAPASPPPISPGTARPRSSRTARRWPRPSAFPSASQFAVADIDLDLLRQERMQMGSFDTNRRRHPAAFRRIGFRLDPPAGDIGLERKVERFPFVPADAGAARAGLLRGLQHPGLRPGAAAARDRHQARGDRRVRRARFHPGADRLRRRRSTCSGCRAPTSSPTPCRASPPPTHTKANAIRLMEALGVTWQELDIRPAARTHAEPTSAIRSRSGEPVYDMTFENVQAGLRTDYLFRLANHHDGIVIGTGDLSELALGWCTYGVGDQMAHYNVNAGVPKTLIQHLIRWVISSRQFAPDVRATLDAILATEISPELVPDQGRRDAAEHRGALSAPTRCRTSTCTTRCATASCRRRSRSWRCTPGAMRRSGDWPPRLPAGSAQRLRPGDDPQLAGGVPAPLLRVQPVQALGDAERAEGQRRRVAVAARRLARAVGRQRQRLARRTGTQRAEELGRAGSGKRSPKARRAAKAGRPGAPAFRRPTDASGSTSALLTSKPPGASTARCVTLPSCAISA